MEVQAQEWGKMEPEDGDHAKRSDRQERTGVQVALPPRGEAEPASCPAAQLVRTVWVLTNTFRSD